MIQREVLLAGAVAGLPAAAVPMLARARVLNGFDLSGALVPPAAIEAGGPPRDGIPAFWFAWVAFHPGTDLPKEPEWRSSRATSPSSAPALPACGRGQPLHLKPCLGGWTGARLECLIRVDLVGTFSLL